MAKVKIQGHASGTGVLTVTAPNTSTDSTITLPDGTGTLLTTDGDGSNLTGITHTDATKLPLAGGTMTGVLTSTVDLSSDTQSTPETVASFGAKFASISSNGVAGSGARIELKIPDDETNPITGAAIAALKENGDDSNAEAALAFYISQNDTTLDEAMRIDSSGNVGIGTTSPNIISGSNAHLDIRSPTYSFIELGVTGTQTSGDVGYLEFMNGNNNRMATVVGGCDGANDDGYMRFSTANSGNFTERMRIDSSGKVGIGTTSPSGKLHIQSTDSFPNNDSGAQLYILDQGATSSRSAALGVRVNTVHTGTDGALITIENSSSSCNALRIDNRGTGHTFNFDGKMYMNSDGHVGIGTSSPTHRLDIFNSSNSWNKRASIGLATEAQGTYNAELYYHRGTSSESDRGFKIRVHDTLSLHAKSDGHVGSGGAFSGKQLRSATTLLGTSGAWTTQMSLSSYPTNCTYLVAVDLQGIGSYTSIMWVWKHNNSSYFTIQQNGSNSALRMNGHDIQFQQNSGADQSGSSGTCKINMGPGLQTIIN